MTLEKGDVLFLYYHSTEEAEFFVRVDKVDYLRESYSYVVQINGEGHGTLGTWRYKNLKNPKLVKIVE